MTVGSTLAEPLKVHFGWRDDQITDRVQELLDDRRAVTRARQPLPARVLRRAAPARRHRPGAGPRARADRARRAGVGARRVDPGRRRQPARDAAGPARPRLRVHRPRPVGRAPHLRPGGGDVPRQDRRGGRPRRDLRPARAPLHPGAAVGRPAPGPQAGAGARAHPPPGRRAVAGQPAQRLPVPHPLLEEAGAGGRPASTRRPASSRSRCSTPPPSATRWRATSPPPATVV